MRCEITHDEHVMKAHIGQMLVTDGDCYSDKRLCLFKGCFGSESGDTKIRSATPIANVINCPN